MKSEGPPRVRCRCGHLATAYVRLGEGNHVATFLALVLDSGIRTDRLARNRRTADPRPQRGPRYVNSYLGVVIRYGLMCVI